MNRSRIVTLVIALAVVATVGSAVAQESAEPEQLEEIREIVIEIGADVASAEGAEQLADVIREEVEASGQGNLEIFIEQTPEDDGEVEPLGSTVTLEFAIQESSDPVSVTTASREYAVSAQWSRNATGGGQTVVEDNSVDVVGTIDMDDENDTFLVTCWGSFTGARQYLGTDMGARAESDEDEGEADSEEVEEGTFVDFQASAMFRPNQTRVIASRGEQKLELTVSVDQDD